MRRLLLSVSLLSMLAGPAMAEEAAYTYKFKYVAILADDQGHESAWHYTSRETFPTLDVCTKAINSADDSYRLGIEKTYPKEHLTVVKTYGACYFQTETRNFPLLPLK